MYQKQGFLRVSLPLPLYAKEKCSESNFYVCLAYKWCQSLQRSLEYRERPRPEVIINLSKGVKYPGKKRTPPLSPHPLSFFVSAHGDLSSSHLASFFQTVGLMFVCVRASIESVSHIYHASHGKTTTTTPPFPNTPKSPSSVSVQTISLDSNVQLQTHPSGVGSFYFFIISKLSLIIKGGGGVK